MKKLSIVIMLLMVLSFQSINLTYAKESTENIIITKGAYDEACSKFNQCFVPSELLTCVGTKVTWTNDDIGPHQIYSGKVVNGQKLGTYSATNDGKIESDPIAPDDAFSYVFTKAGTYQYHSAYHLHAQGVIVVRETCDEIVQKTQILSPLKQFKSGIPINKIQCKEGLQLVIKTSNDSPVCVHIETGLKLLERKWAYSTIFGISS